MTATLQGPTARELQHRRLEGRIAELMGLINAATAEVVEAVREVLDDTVWNVPGARTPEHWLMWRAGVSAARAAGWVQMARRADELPVTMARFAAGELTEDTARVIAAKTPAARDGELAELGTKLMHNQLRRVLRHLPDQDDADGRPQPKPKPERTTRFGYRDDGWWELHSLLPPDEGAQAQKALEAARDAERDDRKGNAEQGPPVGWSDALVRLAQAGLDGLDPAVARGQPRGERFQVIFHCRTDDTGTPTANLHLGPALPDALRRYLLCDPKVRAAIEHEGRLVGISPLMATADHRLRIQIEARDGGCRFPGCGQARWLHIHHLVHREDGGPTVPTNLCCLCPFHHRLHHQGAYAIEGDPSRPDGLVFRHRNGEVLRPPQLRRPAKLPPPGAPAPTFQPPLGERLDARWFTWN